MYQLIALLTGLILAVMISINGSLSQIYGVFIAAVIIHIVGIAFATLLCRIRGEHKKARLFGHSPWWMYLGGALGVIPTLANNFAYGKISMTSIVALGLLGQTLLSLLIDSLGLFGMEKHAFRKTSLIGILFSLAGVCIMTDHSVLTGIIAVIVSILSGVFVVMSRTVNARLAEKTGAMQGSLINHLVGFPIVLLIAVIWCITSGSVPEVTAVPHIWIYLGGMLGVTTVVLYNITVPKVSAFRQTILTFIGQVFTGIALDLLTGSGYSAVSFIGGIVVSVGIALNICIDHFSSSVQSSVQS